MKDEKGYEILDGKAECEDEYQEGQERLRRVQGYSYPDRDNDNIDGFIKRNNVRDRI
jgi:hypothetical protein